MSVRRLLVPTIELHQSTLALLAVLCEEHGIVPVPSLEWSARMRRVLGRAYIRENFIRLSVWLDDAQAHETLRHELAHIAVGHGKREPPHGPRWKEWAVRLGANPRATSHVGPLNAPERPDHRCYWGLECPGCGFRLLRIRVLPGLYHRACGPRHGIMRRVVRGGLQELRVWAGDAPAE